MSKDGPPKLKGLQVAVAMRKGEERSILCVIEQGLSCQVVPLSSLRFVGGLLSTSTSSIREDTNVMPPAAI